MKVLVAIFILAMPLTLVAKSYHFVLMGGYRSCGWSENDDGIYEYDPYMQRAYPSFVDFMEDIEEVLGPDSDIQATVTCYTYSMSSLRGIYLKNSKTVKNSEYIPFNEVQSRLESLASPDAQLVIVGHSYGGWLAMRFFEDTYTNNTARRILFTIDPISVQECYWWTVSIRSRACNRAPADIDWEHVRLAVDYWANYYQRDHTWLNSSVIDLADSNMHVHYGYLQKPPLSVEREPQSILGHNQINTDPRVWNDIKSNVKKSLTL